MYMFLIILLMRLLPPRSTLTGTLFPYTTLLRSPHPLRAAPRAEDRDDRRPDRLSQPQRPAGRMRLRRSVRIGLWRRLAPQILSQQDRRHRQSSAAKGTGRSRGRDARADAPGVDFRRYHGPPEIGRAHV